MKFATLTLALIGLATAMPVSADTDASQWHRSELIWNEEYDTFVVAATLDGDLFQERLVWSNHYADFVPVATAYEAELRNYQEGYVWSETHSDMVPRAMVEPCPRLSKVS